MTNDSLLDRPEISGRYLFPQPRLVDDPFVVDVGSAKLACYHRVVDPDGFTLVHFHGNGEAVADYMPDAFQSLGMNSLYIEYREYGGSTGTAQLAAMLPDGKIAVETAGIDPAKAIVFGRSIGSLYAIELASRLPTIAGLILESGIADPLERFLVYADLELAGISEAEVKVESSRVFNHQEKLSSFTKPLLVLHTENDGLVDISHAERNHQWAGSASKRLVRFEAGNHNTIMHVNAVEYFTAIQEFIASL